VQESRNSDSVQMSGTGSMYRHMNQSKSVAIIPTLSNSDSHYNSKRDLISLKQKKVPTTIFTHSAYRSMR